MFFLLYLVGVFFTSINAEWITDMENPGLFEGDMILTPEQIRETLKGTFTLASTIGKQWPNNIIPYDYSLGIVARPRAQQVIQQAIDEYHKYTCIKFVQRTTEKHYVHFYEGNGCSSYVGYGGGGRWPMPVSLPQNCWRKSIVMHELGHAIGLHHEQNRPDRDDHIEITWENIKPEMKFNFEKQKTETIDSLGTKYDYSSIMHYGKTAFAKQRGLITIKTKDPNKQEVIGKAKTFSQIDIEQINKLYRCGSTPPVLSTRASTIATHLPTTHNPSCQDETPRSCPGWRSLCLSHPHIAQICKKTCKLC